MRCTSCESELKENAKFCHRCGTKVEKEIRCSNCHHLLEQHDLFCSECGAGVTQKGDVSDFDFSDFEEEIDFDSFFKIEETQNERLAGICLANQHKSWVNQYKNWIYLMIGNSIWKMSEDGQERVCINNEFVIPSYNKNLNINQHGVFFIDDVSRIVRLDLDGNFMNFIPFKTHCRDVFYVYDDTIYFSDFESDSVTLKLCSCKVDGSNRKILKNIRPKDKESIDPHIEYISVNDKKVVFKVYLDNEEENSGWFIMNSDGSECQKLRYQYRIKDSDGDYEIEELSIFYIDMDTNEVYTSGMPSENKRKGVESGVWKRKLGERLTPNSYKELIWEIIPHQFSNGNFGGYYTSGAENYFDGNVCYGFTYGHRGSNSDNTDHYYNLYQLYSNGDSRFLNAGSRGGIEELVIIGKYAYFDSELELRAKLDGSGMEEMREWFQKFEH